MNVGVGRRVHGVRDDLCDSLRTQKSLGLVLATLVGDETFLHHRRDPPGMDRRHPKLRLVVCEAIPVEQAKPTLMAAKELTAELQKRVDAAR